MAAPGYEINKLDAAEKAGQAFSLPPAITLTKENIVQFLIDANKILEEQAVPSPRYVSIPAFGYWRKINRQLSARCLPFNKRLRKIRNIRWTQRRQFEVSC